MNIITVVLVVALFGVVCSSYAIDCMDVWDDESIAEMLEEDRHYEESLRAGHQEHQDEEEHDDDEHTDGLTDANDEDHEDHEDDADRFHSDEQAETHSEHQRQKREDPSVEQPIPILLVEDDPSDLEAAETHLFRPVFRYKSQYTERRRVRTSNGGANLAPTQ